MDACRCIVGQAELALCHCIQLSQHAALKVNLIRINIIITLLLLLLFFFFLNIYYCYYYQWYYFSLLRGNPSIAPFKVPEAELFRGHDVAWLWWLAGSSYPVAEAFL